MAPTDTLYARPGVTGLLIGIALRFSNEFIGTDIALVSSFLFAFGVVAALWSDDWWGPAGRALAVAGAFVILVRAVASLLAGAV